SLVVTGLINGASMALYIAALLLTDVVRALVLFYLAPMWGVMMGIFVLHEKLTVAGATAVAAQRGRLAGARLRSFLGLCLAQDLCRARSQRHDPEPLLDAGMRCRLDRHSDPASGRAGGPPADRLGRATHGQRRLCHSHDHSDQSGSALERQAPVPGPGQPDLRHRGGDR